jgi:lipooligosaccharide transport system permease protein
MTAIVRQAPVPSPLSATLTRLFRARRLVQRNLLVYKHTWLVLFSGFFEPLFYLLGIGYGLGSVIKTVELSDGRAIAFAAFVAPGLLAMSSLNGAVAESIFNVFFKLNFAKTYDGILATPLGIREIAVGELVWSLIRGTLYSAAFVVVMLVMGLILSPAAILLIPASLLLGAAFSAAGLATTAYLRTVQDFDIPMGMVVMPMFLFSGVFFPTSIYPAVFQWLLELTPLYHGVNLLRGLTTGALGWGMLWDVAYLFGFLAIGLTIAMRQMERKLIK